MRTPTDAEILEALADLAHEFESCGQYEADVGPDPWEGCEARDLEALEAFCGVTR